MNRLLLIVPPNITYEQFVSPPENVKTVATQAGRFGAVVTDVPLGVLSLSAYVKAHAPTEIALVDFNVVLNRLASVSFPSFTELFRETLSMPRWRDYAPDIIGVSTLFTPSYQSMIEIGRCCRDLFPDSVLVAGGGVPTNMFETIFGDSTCFDALCFGEGEKPLVRLVRARDRRRHLEDDRSWLTRSKMARKQCPRLDFVDTLDEIPFADYALVNLDDYRQNPTISAYTAIDDKANSVPVMTSRGCTYRCCFCSSHTVHGRRMRYYSVGRVRRDLKQIKEQYGARTIVVEDDHFLGNKRRALEIIGILEELGLTAFFPNSLALCALDKRILSALRRIGVRQLVLSAESGSERVLREVMHKPLNLSIVKRVSDDCRELGIYTDVNILIGLPGETKADIEDSRAFLKTVNANWFRINAAAPLVGSEMLDVCAKKGYLKGDLFDCNYKKAIVETEDFTAEYIQEMIYTLNIELNFVENSDFRLGRYEVALQGFENAIRASRDHAIAYYCAARCHEKMGNAEKSRTCMDTARAIADGSPFWRRYADMFGIPI